MKLKCISGMDAYSSACVVGSLCITHDPIGFKAWFAYCKTAALTFSCKNEHNLRLLGKKY